MNKGGRPVGSVGVNERRLRKTLREIITPEMYEEVVLSLYDIAINSNSPKAKIDASKFIVERIEGALPQVIETNVSGESIKDILARVNNTTGNTEE